MGRHRNYGGSGSITPEPIDAMLQVTITLSAAQVNAIHTTPQTLVPAPGPGFMLLPISIVAQVRPGATPFAAGNTINLVYGPAGTGAFWGRVLFAADVQSATTLAREWLPLDTNGFAPATAALENLSLDVNAGNDFTTGNGQLTFTIAYQVVPLF